MSLRDYQQRAFNAAIEHLTSTTSSGVIDAATGAGKSHIIAALSSHIIKQSGLRVLCLAPSKELVEQNHHKYPDVASIYCASAGSKCIEHDVVFGSPKSVINNIDDFGDQFCAVIVDEAHGITPTIQKIIAKLKGFNENMRVIGLTATPYRTGTGYIYEFDEDGVKVKESINPYFKKLICRVTARELIAKGWLTPPTTHAVEEAYSTSKLKKNNLGNFTDDSVRRAFEGKSALTKNIVNKVVALSHNRKGVMFFAATISHAKEIIKHLPADESTIITSETKKKDRTRLINLFKDQRLKYIVNVGVLTTGFDAPHVDVVAVLRATESAGLFQQIMGRGLRLFEGKLDCLMLDFAGNIERHGLEDDLFEPKIEGRAKKDRVEVPIPCPSCDHVNQFARRQDDEYVDLEVDEEGYFLDLAGKRIETEYGPMPGHYGRRCNGMVMDGYEIDQCPHRWSFKACPNCDADNDIAARRCVVCNVEIISPSDKLALEFKKMKKNPHVASTDKVIWCRFQMHHSKKDRISLMAEYKTDYRTVTFWYHPGSAQWTDLNKAVFGDNGVAPGVEPFLIAMRNGHGKNPRTITSKRQSKSNKYFDISAHNKLEDKEP